jgi:hypothetical protein
MFEVEVNSLVDLPGGGSIPAANYTSVSSGDIADDPQVRTLMAQLGSWVEQARGGYLGTNVIGPEKRSASMFNRQLYRPPDNPYEQMRVARIAVAEDDIVSAIADATEALAFSGGLKWESSDPDEADIFNQLSADLNLDGKIREMWRDLFTYDQFVLAKLWDTETYTVRGETDQGNKKKKKFDGWTSLSARLALLNPAHIVPVGYGPLREDLLAWQATDHEIDDYRFNAGSAAPLDPLMTCSSPASTSPRRRAHRTGRPGAWTSTGC